MAEAALYKGEIPKKYKEPEKDEEKLYLRVFQPDMCPFRIEDKCTLCMEGQNILTGCGCDFQRPPSCPLEKSDVIITIDKTEPKDEEKIDS